MLETASFYLPNSRATKPKKEMEMKTEIESIRIFDTLHIFVGTGNESDKAKQKVVDKGHADGHTVIRKGVKTHHHFKPFQDLSKSGSDQYIFDKSGNRVKGNLVEYTNQEDGSVTKRIIRTTYRSFE